MVKGRISNHLTYLGVWCWPTSGRKLGQLTDLLRLFGMNGGKNECESEPCHRSRAGLRSHPAWCGERNIEWHASPRAPQLITLSWPYLAPRCFHLSLINCQPRVSLGVGGGNEWREGDAPDVFWEDGRKLFLRTNAFRHPLCLQMLNLGTLPGSLFSLKRKFVVCLKHPRPVSPVSGRISFACGWSFVGLRGA